MSYSRRPKVETTDTNLSARLVGNTNSNSSNFVDPLSIELSSSHLTIPVHRRADEEIVNDRAKQQQQQQQQQHVKLSLNDDDDDDSNNKSKHDADDDDENDNDNDDNKEDSASRRSKRKTKKGDEEPALELQRENSDTERRQFRSVLADGWWVYLVRSFRAFFLGSWLNLLLFLIPFAIAAKAFSWGDGAVLVLSLLSLCPLAERISFVTDEFCKYTNDTIGGLLSATMGNVTEVIVSLIALNQGLLRVTQVSLIGSILSNLLLVLGCAFVAGGLKKTTQTYNKSAAQANSGLLQLAVMALLFPMTLTITSGGPSSDPQELNLSRFSGFLLLIVYALLIIYQLYTHKSLFDEREEDEDDEPPVLGPVGSFVCAILVTVMIGILSEFVVSAISGAASQLGIPVLFIATILLPIVGNAAEHASAVIFASRSRMDISLGIAVGSATQIALFVIPLSIIAGWGMGQPLSLDFQVFETVVLFLTVTIVTQIINSGKADWLRGLLLIVAYLLISASYWVHSDPADLAAP